MELPPQKCPQIDRKTCDACGPDNEEFKINWMIMKEDGTYWLTNKRYTIEELIENKMLIPMELV